MPSAMFVLTTRWMPSAATIRSVPSALRDRVHRALRGAEVEPRAAAEEVPGIEIAQDQVGVGHGGGRAALAVARRARLGARALGPDVQDAAGVHPGDRAAARAERDDVEARQRHLLARDRPVRREVRLAVLEERDVGAGPAHVEGDQVALAEEPRAVAAPRHAARRARQHRAGGEPHGVGDRRHAAVRLHDQHRPGVARLDEPLGQAREVARRARARRRR